MIGRTEISIMKTCSFKKGFLAWKPRISADNTSDYFDNNVIELIIITFLSITFLSITFLSIKFLSITFLSITFLSITFLSVTFLSLLGGEGMNLNFSLSRFSLFCKKERTETFAWCRLGIVGQGYLKGGENFVYRVECLFWMTKLFDSEATTIWKKITKFSCFRWYILLKNKTLVCSFLVNTLYDCLTRLCCYIHFEFPCR